MFCSNIIYGTENSNICRPRLNKYINYFSGAVPQRLIKFQREMRKKIDTDFLY